MAPKRKTYHNPDMQRICTKMVPLPINRHNYSNHQIIKEQLKTFHTDIQTSEKETKVKIMKKKRPHFKKKRTKWN